MLDEINPPVTIKLYFFTPILHTFSNITDHIDKKPENLNFAEFVAFFSLVGIGFSNEAQKYISFGKLGHVINPLTPGTFCQNCIFFYILVVLRLDLGQISFSQVENAFATRQLAVLATRITFQDILPQA